MRSGMQPPGHGRAAVPRSGVGQRTGQAVPGRAPDGRPAPRRPGDGRDRQLGEGGRVRTYQLVPGALDPAGNWIGQQRLPAERRLDRLGTFLNRPATTKE